MDLREIKGHERRKQVRKLIRQGYKEIEIAEKLDVDVTTISKDIAVILQENSAHMLANKDLINKDLQGLLKALQTLDTLEEETWKIYYCKEKVIDKQGNIVIVDVDPDIKLQAIEKLRQINIDRSKLLKLLNPTQINVEKLVYIQNLVPVLINKYTNIAIEYVPKEKQIEFLEKLKIIDIEKMEE